MSRHVVFLDRRAVTVSLRSPAFPHQWQEYPHTSPELTIERLQGAQIAITNRVAITEAVLDAVPTLELVAVAATGYEHVDVAACQERGVAVCNVRDWSVSVPEHVFALTLALRRQLPSYMRAVQQGRWQASPTYGFLLEPLPITLAGTTLGIIGHGTLGKQVAALAQAFGMQTVIAEHRGAPRLRPGRTAFEEVLARSQVLVILCPLNPSTRNLIGTAELVLMRPDALLINCARGGIVDEAALAGALLRGELGGAGVDVLSQEPPTQGTPLLELDLPNLILTPHMAFASVQSIETLAEQLMGNLEAFVAGQPRHLVTTA
ncbi:4-phosphoerythronate dehydrogenase [Deinococcus saxicola]|uniref:D-2-hydroxyacid dehydrogenase n=1 Tax=Deinococcus saxicola TaxID=249406 RepID=UPI0039F06295